MIAFFCKLNNKHIYFIVASKARDPILKNIRIPLHEEKRGYEIQSIYEIYLQWLYYLENLDLSYE